MQDIKAAAVQFEHKNGDKAANMEKIRRFVVQARQQGVELLVFPECCVTGYWFLRKLSREELVELAEKVFDGPSCKELGDLAVENKMTIGAGLVEIDDEQNLFNTYIVAMPDKLRRDSHVLSLVRDFADQGKLVAAICHGGWIAISAGVYRGVRVTGSPGIKDDLVNAGAIWENASVVIDRHFVSSRKPDDLGDFCRGIIGVLVAQGG